LIFPLQWLNFNPNCWNYFIGKKLIELFNWQKLLDSSSFGCSVLMLTNLIDIYVTWACCSNRTSKQAWWCLYWLFSSKNRWRDQLMAGAILLKNKISYSKHQVSDLKEQDQELRIKASRWSEECRIKDEDQREIICLEEFTRVNVLSLFCLGPCVQFLPSMLT